MGAPSGLAVEILFLLTPPAEIPEKKGWVQGIRPAPIPFFREFFISG